MDISPPLVGNLLKMFLRLPQREFLRLATVLCILKKDMNIMVISFKRKSTDIGKISKSKEFKFLTSEDNMLMRMNYVKKKTRIKHDFLER